MGLRVCVSLRFLPRLERSGKTNNAEKAEMTVPQTMDPLKRWVGGKEEKKKIAKPLPTINMDVITGSHIRFHNLYQVKAKSSPTL